MKDKGWSIIEPSKWKKLSKEKRKFLKNTAGVIKIEGFGKPTKLREQIAECIESYIPEVAAEEIEKLFDQHVQEKAMEWVGENRDAREMGNLASTIGEYVGYNEAKEEIKKRITDENL